MQILAADIGGTQTRLALANKDGEHVTVIRTQSFDSHAFPDFTTVARLFLDDAQPIGACFAVAGPVEDTRDGEHCQVTNLPWVLDSNALAKAFGIARVRLINDFQAVGYGIEHLTDNDLITLQAGHAQPHGVRAVIGAGTGLGQALLVWTGQHYEVISTEGGHTDFSPNTELEMDLWRWLKREHNHVSFERVVSGMGIASIYQFLNERATHLNDDLLRAAIAASTDTAATLALWQQTHPMARQTMELFAKVYGAQTGNLALTVSPRGGIFIAGGIAAKNLELMQAGGFMEAFRNKGRMSHLMETIPVHIVTHPHIGLHGATHQAARLC